MYGDGEHTPLKYGNAQITQDDPDFTVERCNLIPEIEKNEVEKFRIGVKISLREHPELYKTWKGRANTRSKDCRQ